MRNRVVVVHHPASDNVRLTLRDHIHPPFIAAPYDWWLEYPGGEVVEGRPLSMDGAHVRPDFSEWAWVNNRTAIGVAFEGNFDDEKPPYKPSDAQIENGAALVGALCAEHKIIPASLEDIGRVQKLKAGVLPHRAVSATACPGRHFMRLWDTFIGKVRWYYQQEGGR